MSMLEYQYIAKREATRPKPESWLTTICILIIIAFLVLFVYRSDQEHERRDKENEVLKNTVSIQSTAISELAKECSAPEKGKKRGS